MSQYTLKVGDEIRQKDTGEIFIIDQSFLDLMNIYHEEWNFEKINNNFEKLT